MLRVQRLNIHWNDDIDAYMTKVDSSDKVLSEFFRIHDWDFIRNIFEGIAQEHNVEYENKAVSFEGESVYLHVNEHICQLTRHDFLNVFYYLFDLIIVGANDDHHGTRYEPWWQEFTEVTYQLKCKIEMYEQVHKGLI